MALSRRFMRKPAILTVSTAKIRCYVICQTDYFAAKMQMPFRTGHSPYAHDAFLYNYKVVNKNLHANRA
jgi:hypothetical protein